MAANSRLTIAVHALAWLALARRRGQEQLTSEQVAEAALRAIEKGKNNLNLTLRGIEADFGEEHADTFRRHLPPRPPSRPPRRLPRHENQNPGEATIRLWAEFGDEGGADRSCATDGRA